MRLTGRNWGYVDPDWVGKVSVPATTLVNQGRYIIYKCLLICFCAQDTLLIGISMGISMGTPAGTTTITQVLRLQSNVVPKFYCDMQAA